MKLRICATWLIMIVFVSCSTVRCSSIWNSVVCTVSTCCTDETILKNFTGLRQELNDNVYGQHIVSYLVPKIVEEHLKNKDPSKALAIAFDGATGTGKNFVASLIARHLYSVGSNVQDSPCVHRFIATMHFPHKNEVEHYKDQLRQWILTNVTAYPRSLFIFDEMDKMPEGVVDAIRPFLEQHHHIDGVNYRKSMFIFLSNAASVIINRMTMEKHADGLKREDIKLKDVERQMRLAAYNDEKHGGFWHSDLIERQSIDFFVPFFPLQRRHVRKCIEGEFLKREYVSSDDDNDVNEVLGEIEFDKHTDFAEAGCKLVANRVLPFLMKGKDEL